MIQYKNNVLKMCKMILDLSKHSIFILLTLFEFSEYLTSQYNIKSFCNHYKRFQQNGIK